MLPRGSRSGMEVSRFGDTRRGEQDDAEQDKPSSFPRHHRTTAQMLMEFHNWVNQTMKYSNFQLIPQADHLAIIPRRIRIR